MAVAIVERWPLWKCMDCTPGQNKVAVVERWPLVEVRLYLNLILLPTHTSCQKIQDPREVGNFSNENEI